MRGLAVVEAGIGRRGTIDTPTQSLYIAMLYSEPEICRGMGQEKVRVGQIWKRDKDGATFLVTRIYTEALATIAVLRATENEKGAEPEMVRAKLARSGQSQQIPGFKPSRAMEEY